MQRTNIPESQSQPSVTGQGEPVIFVHGNASTRAVWREVVHHLRDTHQCISYDLRGHGDAAACDDGLCLEQLVDDLEQMRRALGQDRIALVGHSLGAFVVACYAARHPERVTWTSLMAMPAGRDDDDRANAARQLDALRRDGVAATLRGLSRSWYTASFIVAHPGALQRRLDEVLAIDEETFLRYYALYSRVDVDRWLPRIAAPTLVMTGALAKGCGEAVARYIFERLPNGRMKVFPEMKNGILTEIPGDVARELSAFSQNCR